MNEPKEVLYVLQDHLDQAEASRLLKAAGVEAQIIVAEKYAEIEALKANSLPLHCIEPMPEIKVKSIRDKKRLPNISRWRQ